MRFDISVMISHPVLGVIRGFLMKEPAESTLVEAQVTIEQLQSKVGLSQLRFLQLFSRDTTPILPNVDRGTLDPAEISIPIGILIGSILTVQLSQLPE